MIRSGSYCEVHAKQVQVAYDKQRGSAASRGYGPRWQRFRRMYLRRHPYCTDPYGVHTELVLATEVDHIIPRRQGGSDDESNLQALCKPCHSRKTAMEHHD